MQKSQVSTLLAVGALLVGLGCLLTIADSTLGAGRDVEVRTIPESLPEPSELLHAQLPDGGPRFERLTLSKDWEQFDHGAAAFSKGDVLDARLTFLAFAKENPDHPLIAAAQAFLAESQLKLQGTEGSRSEVIERYRALLRDDPKSTNARRAGWRIGDLYREQGWYQEAQVAYQRTLGHSDVDSYDANRALLGMGYAFLGLTKWREAGQTFEMVRRHTTDPVLVAAAMLAQAHAVYREGRMKDADELFEATSKRWPSIFRKDPYALLRYADTATEFKRLPVARQQLLLFYNVFPHKQEAPFVLIHLGDTFRDAGQWNSARFFYAAATRQYQGTPVSGMARIRYADVDARTEPDDGAVNLRQTVTALISDVPLHPGETMSQHEVFETMGKEYEDTTVGSEAMFHLGEAQERAGKQAEAIAIYQKVVERAGKIEGDPWPEKSGARLVAHLQPRLERAIREGDDFELLTMYHQHGPFADRLYAGSELIVRIADAHRRAGFPVEAARIYQSVIRDPAAEKLQEAALLGLGESYLDQRDPQAARAVFERYRLQYPIGRFGAESLLGLLAALGQEGNHLALVKLGRQWLQHHPKDERRPLVVLKIANALALAKRLDEAIVAYDEVTKTGAVLNAGEMVLYADALHRLNQHAKAMTIYQKALGVSPTADQTVWIRFQIVRLAKEAKQPELARAGLQELKENDDILVQRIAAVLAADTSSPAKAEGGRP
ncbi:MAG: tetratricopeptide repeat protein [Nitrospiraceae bacterium]|nr:tetratricopeptide repeat protein [Nitrospiraceae bacterium]